MSRSLEELLREADESAPPPPSQSRLADRIRKRSRTAARRRRTAGIAAISLSIGIAAAIVFRSQGPRDAPRLAEVTPVTKPSPTVVTPAAAAATLKADAALTMSVVNELRAREQRRARATKARQQSLRENVPASISSELDRAALTMLDHGDRLRRDLKQVDAALAAYRRTIELFPDSRWAAMAKQRIEQLKPDARRVGTQHSLT